MSAMPDIVHIGPYVYRLTASAEEWAQLRVELGPADHDDLWGYTSNTDGVIYIQPGLNPALERTIVLHEVLHAAAFCGGILHDGKRHEEAWVLVVSPPLLDALRRTPGLTDYLTADG